MLVSHFLYRLQKMSPGESKSKSRRLLKISVLKQIRYLNISYGTLLNQTFFIVSNRKFRCLLFSDPQATHSYKTVYDVFCSRAFSAKTTPHSLYYRLHFTFFLN